MYKKAPKKKTEKLVVHKPRTTRPKPLESQIQRSILQALSLRWPRAKIWRNSTTGTFDPSRKIFRNLKSPWSAKGSPDIMLVLDGKFFALEVKRPGGKPSDSQIEFIDDINTAGGHSLIVYGPDDAITFIKKILDSH